MVQKSSRNTYCSSRFNRNIDGRKNRAIAKARIYKSIADVTEEKQHRRRRQQYPTGCQKIAMSCIFVFYCVIPAIIICFDYSILFGVLWAVLVGGLFAFAHLMASYYFKTGRFTEKRELGVGCGITSLFGVVMFGLICLGYILSDAKYYYFEIKVSGIVTFVFLIIGVGILYIIYRKTKKESRDGVVPEENS